MAFVLQVEALLAPIDGASPCGTLEPVHEGQIAGLLSGIKGKPAVTAFRDGQKVVVRAAEEPNWHLLRTAAETLFRGGETENIATGGSGAKLKCKPVKHLGAGMVLALTALQTEGLPGLADGLSLVERLLSTYWDSVHPTAIPESDEPFYPRSNLLSPLATPLRELNDSWRFIERIARATLIDSSHYGKLSIASCLSSRPITPKLDLPDGDAATPENVTAARLDYVEGLEQQQQALKEAIRSAEEIQRIFAEKAKGNGAPNTSTLLRVLKEALAVLEGSAPEEAKGGAASSGKRAGSLPASNGAVSSREEAVKKLAEAAKYFRDHEPASPIPLLLERAQRLAGMNFLRILEELELADTAVESFKKLAGLRDQPSVESAAGSESSGQ